MVHPALSAFWQSCLIGILGFTCLVYVTAGKPPTWAGHWLYDAAGFLIWAAIAVRVVTATLYRCPRCEERFFVKNMRGNPFSRHCMHCGKHYDEPPTSREQREEMEQGIAGESLGEEKV